MDRLYGVIGKYFRRDKRILEIPVVDKTTLIAFRSIPAGAPPRFRAVPAIGACGEPRSIRQGRGQRISAVRRILRKVREAQIRTFSSCPFYVLYQCESNFSATDHPATLGNPFFRINPRIDRRLQKPNFTILEKDNFSELEMIDP